MSCMGFHDLWFSVEYSCNFIINFMHTRAQAFIIITFFLLTTKKTEYIAAGLFVCGVGSIVVSVLVYHFQPTNTVLFWTVVFEAMHVTIYAVTSTNEPTTCTENEVGTMISSLGAHRWALAIGN